MKIEEIERMLSVYYEGMTDEREEELLRKALEANDLPVRLEQEKKLFRACYTTQEERMDVDVPVALEEKISRMIDERNEEEQHFFRRNKARRNWRWVGGVAATVLLLIGIGLFAPDIGKIAAPPVPKDTFSDPEAAYKVLQATLMEVSMHLNEGIAEVEATQEDVMKVNLEIRNEILQ